MHIQEGTITTLTTCTKMTEEVDRRHGVNGNSSKGVSEEPPGHNSALSATGGRLKFFKDGKFILELVRGCAREGERASWVSVPRKTFWPPAAAPPTPPAHHAPSASLSVSDDNSSVQSSPWQRDHCWKQTAPRRNVSKELAMYYCRPATLLNAAIERGARLKRRRPHDATPAPPDAAAAAADPRRSLTNGLVGDHRRNGDLGSTEDALDGPAPRPKPNSDDDREKYYHMKLKKPYQYRKLRVYKKTRSALRRRELMAIVTKLRERAPPPPAPAPAPVNAKLASCRQEHAMVSPRKRILRELERVSLEDQGGKRRAKTVPALSTASYPPPGPAPTAAAAIAAAPPAAPAGPSHAPPRAEPRPHNGAAPRKDAPLTKNASSYSIHSLLSMSDEGASRRSPDGKHSYPPSLKTESPSSVHSPDLSPSPDNYRYRYSSLMSSPSGAALESSTPPPELARYRSGGAGGGGGGGGGGGYASPYSRQWAGSGAQYRGAPARDEWREVPYLYPYAYAAPLYRGAPPLWMQYAMSPAAVGVGVGVGAGAGAVPVPPGPWAPLPHPLLNDHIPKDEPTSDLPLNLSKH